MRWYMGGYLFSLLEFSWVLFVGNVEEVFRFWFCEVFSLF